MRFSYRERVSVLSSRDKQTIRKIRDSFFKKILEDIRPFRGATDTPVLDFWWYLLWVSKPEWAVLFSLGRCVCDVHSLKFTSGVTHADLLVASMAAELLSSTYLQFWHFFLFFEIYFSERTWELKLGTHFLKNNCLGFLFRNLRSIWYFITSRSSESCVRFCTVLWDSKFPKFALEQH